MSDDYHSMERMADAFERMAELLAKFYEKMYPPKHEPRDVTLSRIPTAEDQIKESQGSTEETTDQWLDIGPRERALLESPQAVETRRSPRRVTKPSRVSEIESKP